jgi:hypothetical protein
MWYLNSLVSVLSVAVRVPVPELSFAGTSVAPFKSAFNVTVAACAAIARDAITTTVKIVLGKRFTILISLLLFLVGKQKCRPIELL